MPRANRIHVPGLVWHITQRCHNRAFLLRAQRDRANWRRWLWQARVRYGLCVLDFVATSNHVHLLVYDESGDGAVSQGLQLIEGRVAQDFNRRRGRRGAFWSDRYHAVAVGTESYLWNCLVYIDLNMVRAGAVLHPADWDCGGYQEIQRPRSRYRVLDLDALAWLTACANVSELQALHRERVDAMLERGVHARERRWTEAVAVGDRSFVDALRKRLGLSHPGRLTERDDGSWELREGSACYVTITPGCLAF